MEEKINNQNELNFYHLKNNNLQYWQNKALELELIKQTSSHFNSVEKERIIEQINTLKEMNQILCSENTTVQENIKSTQSQNEFSNKTDLFEKIRLTEEENIRLHQEVFINII
jgi:hypothetical protein